MSSKILTQVVRRAASFVAKQQTPNEQLLAPATDRLNGYVGQFRQQSSIANFLHLKQRPKSLVIFDKDGTIICFHSTWIPWVLDMSRRMQIGSGLRRTALADDVYRLLGFCPKVKKVIPGLLAEATMPEIKGRLTQLLVLHGLELAEAQHVLDFAWKEWQLETERVVKPVIENTRELMETLRAHNYIIAVCTADNRLPTIQTLEHLRIIDLIDGLICGDDEDAKPKPDPYNALKLCREFNVPPERTYMVGDTMADIGMAKRARLAGGIAVLSGIGSVHELQSDADHVIDHIGHITPILASPAKGETIIDPMKKDIITDPLTIINTIDRGSRVNHGGLVV